jgi:hypothetical protein
MRRLLWLLLLLTPSAVLATTVRYDVPGSTRIRSGASYINTNYSTDTTIMWGAYTPVVTYVDTLVPTANGAYTAWTGDYTAVDEVTPSDVDYIYSSSVDQEESYKKTAYTRSGNPDSIVVYWRAQRSGGIASYVGVFADTTGDGTDNYDVTLTASQLLSTSWTTYTVKLGPISNAAADSLKIKFIYVAKTSTATARVSWLQLLAYQRDPGDIHRSIVSLPTALARSSPSPIQPDSVKLFMYLFDINDSLSLRLRMAAVKLQASSEVPIVYQDWVHFNHSATSWYKMGADSARGGDTTADRYADYTEVTVDSATKYNTYFEIKLDTAAVRRAWQGTVSQVLLYSPSEKDSTAMYAFSENAAGANKPYWELYYSDRPPEIGINSPPSGVAVKGYDTLHLISTFSRDATDPGSLDSVIWYAKPPGHTTWQAIANWWNQSSGWVVGGDSLSITTDLKWFTPNTEGVCSLRVQGYTATGNADTSWVGVMVVPSLYAEYPMAATYISSSSPNANYGGITALSASSTTRILAKATGIAAPPSVGGATLSGPRYAIKFRDNGGTFDYAVLRAMPTTKSWDAGDNEGTTADAGEVTWNAATYGTENWATAGGDVDSSKIDTLYFGGSSSTSDTAVCVIKNALVGDSLVVEIQFLSGTGSGIQCADSLILIQAWDYTAYSDMAGTSGWVRTGVVDYVPTLTNTDLGLNLPGAPRAGMFVITSNTSAGQWSHSEVGVKDADMCITFFARSGAGANQFYLISQAMLDSAAAGSSSANRYADGSAFAAWCLSSATNNNVSFYITPVSVTGNSIIVSTTTNSQALAHVQIAYWLVGGTNLTNARISLAQPLVGDTAKLAIPHGLGATPSMMFFFTPDRYSSTNSAPSWTGRTYNSYLCLGWATGENPTTDRGCLNLMHDRNTFNVGSTFYNDYSMAFFSSSTLNRTWQVDSVNSANVVLHGHGGASPAQACTFAMLAISGGAWDAGMDTLPSISGTRTVSTAYQPEGLLIFGSDNTTEGIQATSSSIFLGRSDVSASNTNWTSASFGSISSLGVARTITGMASLSKLYNENQRTGTVTHTISTPLYGSAPNFQTSIVSDGTKPLFHWISFSDNTPSATYTGRPIIIQGN